MSSLQDRILERFLATLGEADEVEPHVVEQLRALLKEGGKPKVDEVVKIFTSVSDEGVK